MIDTPLVPGPVPEDAEDHSRRERILNRARGIGWILAIPAAAYAIWIGTNARDPDAAAEAVGRIFATVLFFYIGIWLVGLLAKKPRLRGWWGWTFVLTAVVMVLVQVVPVGEPQDLSIADYVRDGGGYAFVEADEQDQATFRATLADLALPEGDLEEAELLYATQNDELVATLQVFAFRPALVRPGTTFWVSFQEGIREQAVSMEQIQIAGEFAVLFEAPDTYGVFWHDENLGLVAVALEEAQARAIATALRSANATP